MRLIVGLGNPGPQYEVTRHNAGFLMVDLLAEEAGVQWVDSQSKFQGWTGRGRLLGEDCFFLKPSTYMNLSGRSVGAVQRFYKIPAGETLVLFDDVDLPQGKVKARVGGGHGGHNGVRSILAETGEDGFHRIKLGVGRPSDSRDTADWVLGRMVDQELIALQTSMLDEVKVRLRQVFKAS